MSLDYRSLPSSESRSKPISSWVSALIRVGAGRALRLTCASLLDRLTGTRMQLRQALNAGLGGITRKMLGLPDYPFVVIGVDPGGTTGVSVFLVTETEAHLQESLQLGEPSDVWGRLEELASHYELMYDYEVVFVIEQFDKRPGIADPGPHT
jgi:hypothetical protein